MFYLTYTQRTCTQVGNYGFDYSYDQVCDTFSTKEEADEEFNELSRHDDVSGLNITRDTK